MAASMSAASQLAFAIRTTAQLERGARRAIRKEIIRRIRAAARALKSKGIIGADEAMRGHEDDLNRIIRAQHMRAIEVFGPRVLDSLKGDGSWETKDFADDLFSRLINEWLENPETEHIGRDIARTTRLQIRSVISAGISEGLSISKISSQINKKLGGVNTSLRAHTIARTEIHNASSSASDAAARSAGLTDLEKEWLSVRDSRTRGWPTADHYAQNGTKIGMDEPFQFTTLKGKEYLLLRPGDPKGPLHGTINCRCVLAYRPAL